MLEKCESSHKFGYFMLLEIPETITSASHPVEGSLANGYLINIYEYGLNWL